MLAKKVEEVSLKLSNLGVKDYNIFTLETQSKLIEAIYPKDDVENGVIFSHGTKHIDDVFKLAIPLLQENNSLFNTVIVVKTLFLSIILHDCTRDIDKEHHEISAEDFIKLLIAESDIFKQIIESNEIELDTMISAIREHRASYKGEFSSPISELLSSADRGNPESLDDRITRSYNYAKEHGKNDHDAWMHAIDHMKEKFGRNGYQKLPKMYVDFFKNKIEKLWDDIDKLDYNYNHPCNKMREVE